MTTAPITERHPVTGKFRKVTPLTVARLVNSAAATPVNSNVTVVHGQKRGTLTRAEINALRKVV